MQQLIQLRWIAVAGQIITIAFVHFVFLIKLPLGNLVGVLGLLIAFNVFSTLRWRTQRNGSSHPVSNDHIFISLTVDVAVLTAQLYFSGGATNPFSFLYLLQVVLGAAMLRPCPLTALLALSSACFAWLTLFYHPLELPDNSSES
ncbi:MAG TPA: sensor histidine kinase, partial [Rhodocyclaceae bacterium]|nr:sensor histidine kinase [Rhodocyclaceae bacterium]